MAVLANHLEDEEPNILTNKTCLPNKIQGFSHLEWSASIPYNMAEEPDDVQGDFTEKLLHPSLDLTNKPIRPLLYTKSCNSLFRFEFTIEKYFTGAGICSLNRGISLNQDSLNQELSVVLKKSKTPKGSDTSKTITSILLLYPH